MAAANEPRDHQEYEYADDGSMMVCPVCNITYPMDMEICPDDGSGLLVVPDAPLLTGELLDDRYEIGNVIGSGGMGTVYRGWQPSMERDVAVKVLHPKLALEPRAVKRFFREAQSASRLIHPNIVTIYDFGRSPQGHLYIVMELVQGWTLGDLIYYRAPLEPALAVPIALQVCEALAEAHKHRLVHRDLKPDNVQLTLVEGRVLAKVLDFGIARMLRDTDNVALERALSTIEIAGTPAYMSPEQILGKSPDLRSDLYSLGVMLFEMLVGKRPFSDDNSVSLCMKQINESPPRVSAVLGPDMVPDELDRLVDRLLEKDVDKRPQKASDIQTILRMMPEARDFGELVELLGEQQPSGLAELPTRRELPPEPGILALSALAQHVAPAPGQSELGGPAVIEGGAEATRTGEGRASLSAVLAKARRSGPPTGRWTVECETCSSPMSVDDKFCSLCGCARPDGRIGPRVEQVLPRNDLRRSKTPVAVARRTAASCVLHIVASNPRILRAGPLSRWLDERDAEGWQVVRQPLAIVVRIEKLRHETDIETGRRVVGRVLDLQKLAVRRQLPLRLGASLVTDKAESAALDVARRLAAVAPPSSLALRSSLVERLGLRGRPLSGVFMPDGAPLACSTVAAAGAVKTADHLGQLHGRSHAVRKLAQLYDDAAREGMTRALVVGEQGQGKTALVESFGLDRPHLYLRVSPLANAWPGHTLARLVRLALGLGDDGATSAFEERIAGLSHRDGEILGLLALDRVIEEPATTREAAAVVLEAIDGYAGNGPFALVLDDVHHLDALSAHLLETIAELAAGKPWILVGTIAPDGGNSQAIAKLWPRREVSVVELKPLGMRAANAFLESKGVPSHRRTALQQIARGNPLALSLAAACPEDAALPNAGNVIERLLPETLRHLDAEAAQTAWSDALLGAPERDRRRVQAARLYLTAGLSPELTRWVARLVESRGGAYQRLSTAWNSTTRASSLWRAERAEHLGAWELAGKEYAIAGSLDPGDRGWSTIQSARCAARSGNRQAACTSIVEAVESAEDHVAELVALAAALLDADLNAEAGHVLRAAQVALAAEPNRPRALHADLLALSARCLLRLGNENGESRVSLATTYLSDAMKHVASLRHVDARRARALEALIQQVRAEVALAEGDADTARVNLSQARDAFRDLGRSSDAIRCLIELGRLELLDESWHRAVDTFRACLSLATAAGLRQAQRRAAIGLGEAMLSDGQAEEGTRRLRQALREVSQGGDARAKGEASLAMARAMLIRNLRADALRYAEKAREQAADPASEARALLMMAESTDLQHRALRWVKDAEILARTAGHGILARRASERFAEFGGDSASESHRHQPAAH